MGVPSFFRWLHRQYPLIISNCIERRDNRDSSKPNPNTEGDKEFDCLYLDMNGIIHPCFHPEGIAPPRSEEEIYHNIDLYILRLFNIVRPRQLLFMAIDGVAPRAKMNQQRMRRFRSAKDNAYNRDKQLHIAEDKGDEEQIQILSDPDYLKKHDSNVITPGTEFFQRLSKHLHEFIKNQIENDPGWKHILVILSDASVPGEGEHKIMKFIRSQRLQPNYNPNRRHVIYGLDADLIFLGLASHEAYFTIIRENVIDIAEKNPEREDIGPEFFHFLNLWVLRQYLERDLRPDRFGPEWNLEFALDDFVFLCFGAGNDFIPSMPGFSVHQGAVRTILKVYKRTLSRINRYVTQGGKPDFYALKELFKQFTYGENKELDTILNPDKRAINSQKFVNSITNVENPQYDEKAEEEAGLINNGNNTTNNSRQVSRKASESNEKNGEEMKLQYYKVKFGFDTPEIVAKEVPKVSSEFIKGMIWVLQYYLYGVPSWNWYYPYHYAPCASDISIRGFIEDYNFYEFDKSTKPFDPLIQLMSVLPPQSAHAVPPTIAYLMTDQDSPLREFYPTKFRVDLNGGTAIWKGVIHIPFIDEKKLFDVINSMDLALTYEEKKRNEIGDNYIFISRDMAPPNNNIQIPINGPFVWGRLMMVPHEDYTDQNKSVFMYSIDYPLVRPGTNMSFLLPGVEIPPLVIDTVINTHKYDTFYDKNTIDQDAIEQSFELPLQIPGYAPGASLDSRHKTYERVMYFQQCNQQSQNYAQSAPTIIPAQALPPTQQQVPNQYPPYAAPYPPSDLQNGGAYYPYQPPPTQYPPQRQPPPPPQYPPQQQQQHHHHHYQNHKQYQQQ